MMLWASAWVTALLASVLITGLARRYAIRSQLLDHPNDRSSHTRAMPRGGGIGIVLVALLSAAVLWMIGALDADLAVAFIGGGLGVAGIGMADDRRAVPVAIRFVVHIAAAVWAVYWLGGLPPLQIGTRLVDLGVPGDVISVVALVWVLNLFNFMDGIDGLAGSEAAFIALAAAGILHVRHLDSGLIALCGCVGMASLGFLAWNWPPAKIFMGDVGSGFLGYVVAVLALADARTNPVAVTVWLILGAVFLFDATITLVRRRLRGEKVHEAHRSHAYQKLARLWNSHQRATLWVMSVNLLWLLPCAVFAALHPGLAVWTALLAATPVVLLVIVSGAGRRDD